MITRLLLTALLTLLIAVQFTQAGHRPLPTFDHPTDFFLEVAKGNVPGHSFITKFGENPTIAAAAGFEDVWDGGGIYLNPVAAVVHNVSSSLAADTGTVLSSGTATGGSFTTLIDADATFVTDTVAFGDRVLNDTNVEIGVVTSVDSETQLSMIVGMSNPNNGKPGERNEFGDSYRVVTNASTGASIFHIVGHDVTRVTLEEFVVLNGGTDVETIGLYARQYRARVFGSFAAAGVITSTTDDIAATVSAQIINGNNQTLMTPYSVPADKHGYIVHWWGTLARATGGGAVADILLRAGTKGPTVATTLGYVLQSRSIDAAGSSDFDYRDPIPNFVPGGVDIWAEADTSALAGVAVGFTILLIDHP